MTRLVMNTHMNGMDRPLEFVGFIDEHLWNKLVVERPDCFLHDTFRLAHVCLSLPELVT